MKAVDLAGDISDAERDAIVEGLLTATTALRAAGSNLEIRRVMLRRPPTRRERHIGTFLGETSVFVEEV